MDKTLLFNELPRPTFRWLGVNHTEGTIWKGSKAATITVSGDAAVVSDFAAKAPLNAAYEGVDPTSLEEVMKEFTHGYEIHVPKNGKDNVILTIDAEDDVEERFRLAINLEENAELKVTVFVTGKAKTGHVALLTEIKGAANSHLEYGKVQLLSSGVQHFEHRYTELADNAKATYTNIELGSAESFLNYRQELLGTSSEVVHDLAYCANGTQKIDISMLMTHAGKKSISDIHTVGALADTAKKSFRGTLDFLRGSMGSEGAEEDTSLLLDKNVKSVSLPLLLCKEDNVSGNHASSAGQLDQSKLFYIMSRGFSEMEAKHMIVESMLRPLIDRIGHPEIEEAALAALREKI